jgi:hypothetical protein
MHLREIAIRVFSFASRNPFSAGASSAIAVIPILAVTVVSICGRHESEPRN